MFLSKKNSENECVFLKINTWKQPKEWKEENNCRLIHILKDINIPILVILTRKPV